MFFLVFVFFLVFIFLFLVFTPGKTRYVRYRNVSVRYFGTEEDGRRILEQLEMEDRL